MELYEISCDIEEMMDLASTSGLAKSEEEFKRIEAEVMGKAAKIREKVTMWEREKVQRSKGKSRKRGK